MTEKLSHMELEAESSLLTWYPKIVGKIPTPETIVLKLPEEGHSELYGMLDGKPLSATFLKNIEAAMKFMKEPFFLRTDQASGKHNWLDTCFVQDKSKILQHLYYLVEFHACAGFLGLNFDALVFREYLPLQSQFTAFNGMPVAPEWRWFVRDGEPVCKHFYWVEDCILNPSRTDWKQILQSMRFCAPAEDRLIAAYATIFAEKNPGFWSVDFALTKNQGWVLIDAARGELSWHPPDCPQNPAFNPFHQEDPDEDVLENIFVPGAEGDHE